MGIKNFKSCGEELEHITDLYGCDKNKLEDVKFVRKFLNDLPNVIGMHKIAPPKVIRYKGSPDPNIFDKGGVSGFVIIAESHISIHTFTLQKYACIDVFSCAPFDKRLALVFIKKMFEPKLIEENFINRGILFDRKVKARRE